MIYSPSKENTSATLIACLKWTLYSFVCFICVNWPFKSLFLVWLQLWFYSYFKSRSFFLWRPHRPLLVHPYVAAEVKNGKFRALNWTLAL